MRTSSRLRSLIVALSLCVLAMRIAIPSGYMLDANASGWPRLTACPAAEPAAVEPMPAMEMGAQASPHDHHGHDHKSADHPCAFSAASAAVDLAAWPHAPPLPHARADTAIVRMHLFARPGLGLAAPPPPKTGPPTFA